MERERNPGSVDAEGLSPGLRCAASRLREWHDQGERVVLDFRSLTLGNGRWQQFQGTFDQYGVSAYRFIVNIKRRSRPRTPTGCI